MKAEDATEFMEREKSEDRFKTRAAIAIACLAALLAITGLGGNNATKEALNENVLASNDFTFFQAKNQRQTTYLLAANELELSLPIPRSRTRPRLPSASELMITARPSRAMNPSRRRVRARKSCCPARESTRSSATTRSSRIPISITPRRCCKLRSC